MLPASRYALRPLNTAYASAQTGPGGQLEPVQKSPDEVRALFADALAAEPPRPVTFILYFVEGTDQFTPESQALVAQVLLAIASRPAPELAVAGHTDTVGTEQFNDTRSLRRAERVRALLSLEASRRTASAPSDAASVSLGCRHPTG